MLVGGGHAHIEVLRSFAQHPSAQVALTLISPGANATYSGMLPGVISGRRAQHDAQLDLRALCTAARAQLVPVAADRVDCATRTVLADGQSFAFDQCSLDVGSGPTLHDVHGANDTPSLLPLRPVSEALQLPARIRELPADAPLVIVGGGAAGVEVACAVAARRRAQGHRGDISVVHRGARLLEESPEGARQVAQRALASYDVGVMLGRRIARMTPDGVMGDDGMHVPSALTIWVAGATPPALLTATPLALSPRGYLSVDDTLRSTDGAPLWGAGDCVDLSLYPWIPKSGVYAVRAGPVLAHNLRAVVEGRPLRRYTPQRRALAILDLADGTAVATRGPWWWHGRSMRQLKDWIDQRFMNRYR